MLSMERRLIDWIEEHRMLLFMVIMTALALLIRTFSLDLELSDAQQSLLPWFEAIKEGGGFAALATQEGDYNIAYQVLIAIMTYLPFDPLRMYKYLSFIFDFGMAIGVAGFVYDLTDRSSKLLPAIGYCAVLFLPSVISNSEMLAQCDSIYTCFVIWALWFLYRKHYVGAFVFLGLAFSFKIQTLFILPFFLIYYFREKKFSLLYFLFLPLMLYVTSLPALLVGRDWLSPLKIYLHQTEKYDAMYLNFASFWSMVTEEYYVYKDVAIVLTIAIFGMMLIWLMEKGVCVASKQNFLLLMCWSVWTCVLFLPAMHERYAYMLDILLIVLTMVFHSYCGYAVVAAMISIIQFGGFLNGIHIDVKYLAVAYLAAYCLFTWKMLKTFQEREPRLPKGTEHETLGEIVDPEP